MLAYTLTRDQFSALEGLAYWIADLHYMREKWGDDEPEVQRARDTVEKCCFPSLDRLAVPFWVQNSVICWAENWRNTKKEYLKQVLERKNILVV